MSSSRQELLENVFAAAQALDPAARASYLNEACGADKALQAEVETLLVSAAASEEFFASLANRIGGAALFDSPGHAAARGDSASHRPGECIGPYTLLDL